MQVPFPEISQAPGGKLVISWKIGDGCADVSRTVAVSVTPPKREQPFGTGCHRPMENEYANYCDSQTPKPRACLREAIGRP